MATPSVTGTPQGFGFTTSGTVVTYTGGGATGSNVYDVLVVNSDNTVTTPSGWTLAVSAVTNQGAYIFYKAENGTTSVTINLGGNVSTNTDGAWLRIQNSAGLDAGTPTSAQANASPGSATPSLTTGSLGASTDLAIGFAALHAFTAGTPTGGAWSTGYTEQANGTSGSGGSASYGSVAVKVPAGTAAETPSYTWTNATSNRYMLFAAFSPSAGTTTSPNGLAISVALGTPSAANAEAAAPTGIAVPVALGTPSAALNQSAAPTGIAIPVALGNPTVPLASVTPTGIAVPVALGTPSVGSAVGPTGIAVPVSLGTPSVSLNRSAAPTGISVSVSVGTPSATPITSPSGISVSVFLGSPTVTTPAPTADARPGSWYGLLSVDQENLQNLRDERGVPSDCPNDGEPLQLNPRTHRWQCRYDGYVYQGW